MLFLNIVSMQFDTVFLALNKSREACSMEIFIEISGHCASLLSYLIPPLSNSFRGANKWKLLCTRSGLCSRCVSAIFCVVWWVQSLSCWNITSCAGINLADNFLKLRCSLIIFWAEMTSRLNLAAVSCICFREFCWCYQLLLLYAAHQCERHHRPTDGRHINKHTTQIHVMWAWNSVILDTAACLWWITALETPSFTRNLITIRCSCCKLALSVEIKDLASKNSYF